MYQNNLTSERLLTERKRLNWTQQQAADVVGVRREMWVRYEAGAEPGVNVLIAFADAGADAHYILTGERMTSYDAAELALVNCYRRCSPEGQIQLIQTAALLAAGISPSAIGAGLGMQAAPVVEPVGRRSLR